jgi:hypothetical protein
MAPIGWWDCSASSFRESRYRRPVSMVYQWEAGDRQLAGAFQKSRLVRIDFVEDMNLEPSGWRFKSSRWQLLQIGMAQQWRADKFNMA